MTHANPYIKFPLLGKITELQRELTRLVKLAHDWETLMGIGMSFEEAEEALAKLDSQYLSLESYGL